MMKQQEAQPAIEDHSEQIAIAHKKSDKETPTSQQIKTPPADYSPEVLQQIIASAIVEANRSLNEGKKDSEDNKTQGVQRKPILGGFRSFIDGLILTLTVIFAPRKCLPQTKADTDTLVHTYTMLVHMLATAIWYIAGFLFWAAGIVRLIPNGVPKDVAANAWQKIHGFIHSVGVAEALTTCFSIGFLLLGIGGIFRLVSKSLTYSKDMDKNDRIMVLDTTIITAFVAIVLKCIHILTA